MPMFFQVPADTLCRNVFSAVLLCIVANTTIAETIHGKVVGVSDGDTITVLDGDYQQYKIRLAGIDAPEKSQAFGNRSKEHLSDLVFGKSVSVDWSKKDRYGRTIGKVLVSGTDANLQQVRAGLAWHYKAYEKEQSAIDRISYVQAESDARNRRSGLWADAHPIPPWDYRHRTGDAATTVADQSVATCTCGVAVCAGPKGGRYCTTSSGNKKYQKPIPEQR